MNKILKIIITSFTGIALISFILLAYFYIFPLKDIKAGAGDNVFGFGWSDNIGWISFNNVSGGGANNYGANITDNGTTGTLSGYAWSNNAGWISFNSADLAGCPTAPCLATVSKITGQVFGWAKFLTTGDWIRLRGNGCNVSISKSTGDFFGWAWGGETGGWISFNCNQTETGNICPSANYKVFTSFDMNIKPTVSPDPVPNPPGSTDPVLNPEAVNLCSNPAYSFSWTFSDLDPADTQSKYQLQVDKEGSFDSFGVGEVDITLPFVANQGVLQTKEVLLANNPGLNQLGYNTNYKWRIRVWDNWNGVSAWVNGINFNSPAHIYPSPNFTWKPSAIVKDQLVQFCSVQQAGVCDANASICYGASYPFCLGSSFYWTLPFGAEFASSTSATTPNPVVKFTNSGRNQIVSLQIQDAVGACSASKNVNVTLPLPKWKEIPPQ